MGQVELNIQLTSFENSLLESASNWSQVLEALGQKWGSCIKPRSDLSFYDWSIRSALQTTIGELP